MVNKLSVCKNRTAYERKHKHTFYKTTFKKCVHGILVQLNLKWHYMIKTSTNMFGRYRVEKSWVHLFTTFFLISAL